MPDILVYNELKKQNIANSQRMAYAISDMKELTIPTYDGSGQSVHPSVVYIPAGLGGYKYWMAMTPYPNGNDDYENASILASNNGVTWVVPAGLTNPVAPPPANLATTWNADPELVYNWQTNKLMLWWAQYTASTGKTFYSESTDGVTWSAPVQCNLCLSATAIVHYSTDLFIAFTGTYPGEGGFIKHTSTNGTTWTPMPTAWTPDNDVISIFGGNHFHVSTLLDAGGFHFLSAAHGEGTHIGSNRLMDLFYGYSLDGKFIVFDSTPLVQRGSADFAGKRIYRSSMVNIGGNKYRAYISSEALDGTWHLSYCDFVINNPAQSVLIAQTNNILKKQHTPKYVDLCTSLQIRDTIEVTINSNVTEFGKYKHKAFMFVTSLNQTCDLRIVTDIGGGGGSVFVGTARAQAKITLPTGSGYEPTLVTEEEMKALGYRIPGILSVRLKCTIAPTSGSITIKMICWND